MFFASLAQLPGCHGWSERLILLALFAVVAVITQFMSDAATTALFAPVAVALTQALGRAPEPFVVTVAMAAVVAFLTPIGHHGNLLVYSPGRYRFRDFIKVGTPLTVISAAIVVLLAPIIWRAENRVKNAVWTCMHSVYVSRAVKLMLDHSGLAG